MYIKFYLKNELIKKKYETKKQKVLNQCSQNLEKNEENTEFRQSFLLGYTSNLLPHKSKKFRTKYTQNEKNNY